VSLDEETVWKIRQATKKSSFKNKSRFVEAAVKRFLEDQK